MNYNKSNGWSTILDNFKESLPEISDEAKRVFTDIEESLSNGLELDFSTGFVGQMELADESLIAFLKDTSYAEKNLSNYQSYLESTANSTNTFSKITKAAGTALKSIASFGINMLATYAVTKVFEIGAEAIYNWIHATDIAIEKGKEAGQKIDEIRNSLSEKQKFNDSNAERFEYLQNGVNPRTNQNISLTNDEYSEYLSLCNQIAEIYPSLVQSYDSQGNAILNLGSSAQTATQQLQEMLDVDKQLANLEISDNLQTEYKGKKAEADKLQQKIDEYKTSAEENKRLIKVINETGESSIYNQLDNLLSGESYWLEIDSTNKELIDNIKNILRQNGFDIDEITSSLYDSNGDGIDDKQIINFLNLPNEEELSSAMANVKSYIKTELHDLSISASESLSENIFAESSIKKEIENVWKDFLPSVVSSLETNPNYLQLGENIQNSITNAISNIDYSKVPDNMTLVDYLKQTYLYPISEVFNDETATEVQDSIMKVFSPDMMNLPVNEYSNKVKELLEPLRQFYINAFDDEVAGNQKFQDFLITFGFKIQTEDGQLIDNATSLKRVIKDKAFEKGENPNALNLDSLTYQQLIELEAIVNTDSYGGTIKEAIDKVQADTKKQIESEPITFSSILADDSDDGLSKKVDDFQSNISSIQSALDSLRSGEDVNFTDLTQQFTELSGQTSNLEDALVSLKSKELGNVISDIFKSAKENRLSSSEMDNAVELIRNIIRESDVSDLELPNLKNTITNALMSSATDTIDRKIVSDTVNNIFDDIDIKPSNELQKSISNVLETQDKLNAAMAASVSASGLTAEQISDVADAYSELDGYDPSKIFEVTANGVHLNTQALRDLQAQQEKVVRSEINDKISEQNTLLDESRQKLQELLRTGASQSDILSAEADISGIQAEIEALMQLQAQFDGATSAYQRWLDAQSGGEEGDMYRSVNDTMIKRGKELYDAELYNNKEFRAIADFYSNKDLTNATAEEVKAAYEQALPAIEKYFTTGREGIDAFVTDMKQLSDAEGLGWVDTLEDGSIRFNTRNDQEIADRLGIDIEAVQAIYRMMSEYRDDILLGDTSGLNAYTAQIEQAQQKIADMQANGEITSSISVDYDVNDMSLDEIGAKVDELKSQRVEIDAETNPEAAKSLDDLIAKTEQAYYFKLDLETDGGLEKASYAIELIRQRIDQISTQNPTLSVSAIVNGDEEIQSLAEELSTLPPEVQTTVGIATENVGDVDGIINQLSQNPDSITVPVNYTKGSDPEEVDDATGTANFTLGKSPERVPDATGVANFTLGSHPQTLPTITQTILMKKVGESSGTMLSPAHADGNVALKHDEVALSNEQGQESIVRDGVWRLLPPGTHVEHFKKNDIIFNAAQTKQLLKNGKLNGYGRTIGGAYAEGTYNGMPAHSAGGWNLNISSNSSSTSTTSNTGAVNANTVATNKNTKSKAKATKTLKKLQESFSKAFDWIEEKLDRLQRDIDMAETKADNSVGYQAKNANLSNAQSITKALIQTNNKGATEYFNYAKKVQKQYDSLSNKQFSKDNKKAFQDAVKIIQNGGDLKISSYNEDVRAAIEEYQKWYDKGLECQKQAEELQGQLRELAQTKFDNIADQFDNVIGRIEHTANMLNESIDQAENKGYVGSTKFYETLVKNEKSSINQLVEERKRLTESLRDSMASGIIKKGSTEWYEMQSQIDDVTESIQEANGQLIEYANNIRQIKWDLFDRARDSVSNLVTESEFLIDLMSNDKLYTDEGKMTEEGLATFGLYGMKYDTYMKEADTYRDEMKRINAELANDPSNTKLIDRKNELLKLQQESIQAAEDEKEAIKNLVEDGINKELESLKKLIDKYNEALDSQKDLQDYQRDVADSAKEIASLQKKISAYANDTSDESKMQIQKWQNELEEKQQNLQDKEYDHFISDQKELLDDLYAEYEDILNQRLDNVDELIRQTIDSVNANANVIRDTLETQTREVGYQITSEMAKVWGNDGSVGSILTSYNEKFSNYSASVLTAIGSINEYVKALADKADKNAQTEISNDTSDTSGTAQIPSNTGTSGNTNTNNSNNTANQVSASSTQGNGKIEVGDKITITSNDAGAWKYSSKAKSKNKLNKMLKKGASYYVGDYNSKDPFPVHLYSDKERKKSVGWVRTKWLKGYADGVKKVKDDQLAVTQENGLEIVNIPKQGMLTPLTKGSTVFNNEQVQKLYEWSKDDSLPTSSQLQYIRNKDIVPNTTNSINNSNNNNTVKIELPNVVDTQSLLNELRNNKSVRTTIQDLTIGRITGMSDLQSRYGR